MCGGLPLWWVVCSLWSDTVAVIRIWNFSLWFTGSAEVQQGKSFGSCVLLNTTSWFCVTSSSLPRRMRPLLRDKRGVCGGHHRLWYYPDHLHHYFCVLLCDSSEETEGVGVPWWWARAPSVPLMSLCVGRLNVGFMLLPFCEQGKEMHHQQHQRRCQQRSENLPTR